MLLKTGASRVSAWASFFLQALRRLAQLERFPEKRLLFESLLHQAEQLFRGVGLADEMISAALDRLDRVAQGIVGGQDNHLRAGMRGFDLFEHVQTISVGQLQIEEDKRRLLCFEQAHSRRGIPCHLRLITMPA